MEAMPRWVWFVCSVVVPCVVCAAFEHGLRVRVPGWAWFLVGGSAAVLSGVLVQVVVEFRAALEQEDEMVFRPWFRPFWRLLRVMGLLRVGPPASLEVPNVEDESVPPIRELSEAERDWIDHQIRDGKAVRLNDLL